MNIRPPINMSPAPGTFRGLSEGPGTFRKQRKTIEKDPQNTKIMEIFENGPISIEMS